MRYKKGIGAHVTKNLDVYEKRNEMKEIWYTPKIQKELKETNVKNIFTKYMLSFFSEEAQKNPARCFFWFSSNILKVWYIEKQREKDEKELRNFTDVQIDDIMDENRRRTVFLLNQLLKKYEEDKNLLNEASLKEVISLYDKIQAAEEATKRTELARRKEARETMQTYFSLAAQYGQLKDEEINNLWVLIQNARHARQIQNPDS